MHVHIYIMYVMYVHIYIIYYLDGNRVLGGREAKSTDRPRRTGARGARERGGGGGGASRGPLPGIQREGVGLGGVPEKFRRAPRRNEFC